MNCNDQEIKEAFRRLAKLHHPDKNINAENSSAEMFKLIKQAYDVLSDPDQRRQFDDTLHDFHCGDCGRYFSKDDMRQHSSHAFRQLREVIFPVDPNFADLQGIPEVAYGDMFDGRCMF
jgi:curved DNA-binding protein CbpA